MTIFEYDEELHKKTLHDEGYEDGFSDGKLTNLTELICHKLKKNKTPELIADELEQDSETINRICSDGVKFFL